VHQVLKSIGNIIRHWMKTILHDNMVMNHQIIIAIGHVKVSNKHENVLYMDDFMILSIVQHIKYRSHMKSNVATTIVY
jgi:hypothetical protein